MRTGPLDKKPVLLRCCSILVRAASVLVPAPLRADWQREWLGELYSRYLVLNKWGRVRLAAQIELVRRCSGALWDAAWLNWNNREATPPAMGFKLLSPISAYVLSVVAVRLVGRPLFLSYYGRSSYQYAYFFWLTDAPLALLAFAVVCSFLRWALIRHENAWRLLRLVLVAAFLVVLAMSVNSSYPRHDWTRFVSDWVGNLYGTCLALFVLLCILAALSEDHQLKLLVYGVSVQFVAPWTVGNVMRLIRLIRPHSFHPYLGYVSLLSIVAMVLTWFYVAARSIKGRKVPSSRA